MTLDELLKAREELETKLLKYYTEEVNLFEAKTGAQVTDITIGYIVNSDMMNETRFHLGNVECEIKYHGVRIGG